MDNKPTNGSGVGGWKKPWYAAADEARNRALSHDANDQMTALADAVDAAIALYEQTRTPPAQVGAATDSGEGVKNRKTEALRSFQRLLESLEAADEHELAYIRLLPETKTLLEWLDGPTKPLADSVEAVIEAKLREISRPDTARANAREIAQAIASMPSTDQEGLVADLLKALVKAQDSVFLIGEPGQYAENQELIARTQQIIKQKD